MTLQGELINSFRFSAILFPLLFFIGDRLSSLKGHYKIGILVTLILINHAVTRNYALNRWAY